MLLADAVDVCLQAGSDDGQLFIPDRRPAGNRDARRYFAMALRCDSHREPPSDLQKSTRPPNSISLGDRMLVGFSHCGP